ncbi:MAG: GNAT family N-acetyltransferase [Porcipelethomonas sp.]
MKICHAKKTPYMKSLKRLYKTSFPKYERKPFFMILKGEKRGDYDILVLQGDKGEFLGLAIMILFGDYALLDYFAVEDSERGKGTGSAALKLILEKYRGKKFLLEVESTCAECENIRQRIRRKNFYERCGMSAMNYQVSLFGTAMEILTYGCEVSFEEYYSIQQNVLPEKFAGRIKKI